MPLESGRAASGTTQHLAAVSRRRPAPLRGERQRRTIRRPAPLSLNHQGVACPLHPSETVTTWSLLVAEAVMPGATRVQ